MICFTHSNGHIRPPGACVAQAAQHRPSPSMPLMYALAPRPAPRSHSLRLPRRLYFDAEGDANLCEPMASSLTVVELRGGGGSGSGDDAEAAWAVSQAAWYPDAAAVCTGRPGHYWVSGLITCSLLLPLASARRLTLPATAVATLCSCPTRTFSYIRTPLPPPTCLRAASCGAAARRPRCLTGSPAAAAAAAPGASRLPTAAIRLTRRCWAWRARRRCSCCSRCAAGQPPATVLFWQLGGAA